MTIINTTFILSLSVESEVLDWIRSTYVASARRPDREPYPHILARLGQSPDPESTGVAVHITFPDNDIASAWDEKYGARLRQIAHQRWGEKALSFATYLHVIE